VVVAAKGRITIANHLDKHDTVPLIPLDSARKILWRGFDGLSRWPRSRTLVALPYGATSRAADSLMRVSGIVDFVRLITGSAEGEPQIFGNMFAAKVDLILNNGSTLTAMKARIDSLAAAGTVGILVMHTLTNGGALNSITWDRGDFSALMDYVQTKVASGRLRVMGLPTFLEETGGMGKRRRSGNGH
jgi:hypothetical protein